MNFFKKPSPQEQIRTQSRDLRKVQRELERSQRDLEKQEKQLEIEIKKAAKTGNKQVCAILAKQLVQLRKQKSRCLVASSQVSAVGNQTKVLHANAKLAGAMTATTKTLKDVNQQVQPAKLMQTMQDFDRENTKMSLKQELVDDTLNDLLENSGDEAEEDAVINQVLDEIGIEIKGKLAEAPVVRGPIGESSSRDTGKLTDAELEAQLAKLRT